MSGDPQAVSRVDSLDQKLIEAFPGRVVRKDLVYKLKVGFSIPVYVLEYLLGKHCSTTDEEQIGAGLAAVKQAIAERVVRADQSELIKSRLQRSGSMKLIDLVTVTFDEKDQGGKYWARLMTAGNLKKLVNLFFLSKHLLGPLLPLNQKICFPLQKSPKLLATLIQTLYSLIELGPKETGKSFVFREVSPYAILLSGGQGSVADLFGWKGRKDKPGLVVRYDVVAFDEVAGPNFKSETDKQMYKGYMEQGSFSRGDDKGTTPAEAGIVFNGNIEGDIPSIARTTHLLTPLPENIRNDDAFHDRWHAYLPGWEVAKLVPEHFTCHLGFIADYIAEIFHNQLRPLNYTDAYDRYFAFGNHVGQRDRKAAVRTISGLLKLIHPDGKCTREEMTEYIQFALEMRRRVKEQLKRINPLEFPKVNLSYIDKESGDEFFAECKEIGATRLIPEGPLPPGDVFSVGRDTTNDRVALFRIQVAALPGNGRFQVVGVSAKAVKESARMAFDYLRANAKRVGLDRDLGAYDFNIQVISPTHGKDTADLGVAFYIAILSAIVNKPIAASLVVMGQMSIHGVLSRVEQLGDRLRVVMDAGARLVLIPTVNAADLGAIPPELLDKVRVDFYNDPAQAAFKAMQEA
ncbi:MAG: hypothetical protein NTY19_03495 [Planctomycetota bacterium]|nr:hypothetical protein [Planctomycetota bacterium]